VGQDQIINQEYQYIFIILNYSGEETAHRMYINIQHCTIQGSSDDLLLTRLTDPAFAWTV